MFPTLVLMAEKSAEFSGEPDGPNAVGTVMAWILVKISSKIVFRLSELASKITFPEADIIEISPEVLSRRIFPEVLTRLISPLEFVRVMFPNEFVKSIAPLVISSKNAPVS